MYRVSCSFESCLVLLLTEGTRPCLTLESSRGGAASATGGGPPALKGSLVDIWFMIFFPLRVCECLDFGWSSSSSERFSFSEISDTFSNSRTSLWSPIFWLSSAWNLIGDSIYFSLTVLYAFKLLGNYCASSYCLIWIFCREWDAEKGFEFSYFAFSSSSCFFNFSTIWLC